MTDGLMTPELCGYTLGWASNKCHDVNQNGPCSFISFCTNGGKQHYHASHWTRKIIIQSQIPLLPHQRNPDRGIGLPSVERGAKFLQNERGYEYICRPRKARSHLEDLRIYERISLQQSLQYHKRLDTKWRDWQSESVSQMNGYKTKRLTIQRIR